jgi:hypothetical protein
MQGRPDADGRRRTYNYSMKNAALLLVSLVVACGGPTGERPIDGPELPDPADSAQSPAPSATGTLDGAPAGVDATPPPNVSTPSAPDAGPEAEMQEDADAAPAPPVTVVEPSPPASPPDASPGDAVAPPADPVEAAAPEAEAGPACIVLPPQCIITPYDATQQVFTCAPCTAMQASLGNGCTWASMTQIPGEVAGALETNQQALGALLSPLGCRVQPLKDESGWGGETGGCYGGAVFCPGYATSFN